MPRETGFEDNSLTPLYVDSSGTIEKLKINDEDSINIKLRDDFEFKSADFVDTGSTYCDQHEYNRSGDDQGLVLIFNQENFDDGGELETRCGSRSDVNNLINTFAKLGFNIKKNNIYQDQDREQIIDVCKSITAEECKNKNSLIVVFMSHGNSENTLYARVGQIKVHELIEDLAKHFKNKPKLFIFQACKTTLEELNEQNGKEAQLTFPIYTLPPDTIVYFSTVEGKVSVRHAIRGSWLIEELCRNFLMYGRKEDVVSLLQRTTKCVSILETEVEGMKETYKQMPVVVSTLEKKFFLTSNKFRKNIHIVTNGVVKATTELKGLLGQYSQT